MSDWLAPLWNFFSPKGALQKEMDDGNPSTPTYSAFARYAKTFKYKDKFPKSSEPTNVGSFQPQQELGLTQLQLNAITSGFFEWGSMEIVQRKVFRSFFRGFASLAPMFFPIPHFGQVTGILLRS